jgi:hypothetical protein
MLNVVMLNVVMLNVVMLNVVMLIVVTPKKVTLWNLSSFLQDQLMATQALYLSFFFYGYNVNMTPGNTKGGSITVPFTSCLDWFGLVCFANIKQKLSVVIQLIPNQSNRKSMVQWCFPYSLMTQFQSSFLNKRMFSATEDFYTDSYQQRLNV